MPPDMKDISEPRASGAKSRREKDTIPILIKSSIKITSKRCISSDVFLLPI